jgi:preprotein translocase SecE subunit
VSPMATVNKSSKETESTGKKPKKPDEPVSPIERLSEYLVGVRSEWGKISWPTWPQIWGQTLIVLLMVTIMTTGLFILDYGLHFIITSITPHRS